VSLTVGLTGGIASGKSLVGELFRQHGVSVIDADQVARDVVAPGQPGLSRLVEHFGASILDTDGTLARRRMRERVFSDPMARQMLESLLHPLIHAELARRRDIATGDYRILMIPLLARTGMRELVDRVLVVDAPESAQTERLVQRDGVDMELARSMLAAQETREQRLKLADDILVNNGHPEQLREPVAQLHKHYLQLSRGQTDAKLCLHLPVTPVG
jgi:dephospho-CoA kinase